MLDWQVGWFRAVQNLIDVGCCTPVLLADIHAVAHQSSSGNVLAKQELAASDFTHSIMMISSKFVGSSATLDRPNIVQSREGRNAK